MSRIRLLPTIAYTLFFTVTGCGARSTTSESEALRDTFTVALPKSEGWLRQDGLPADDPSFFRFAIHESESITLTIEVAKLEEGTDVEAALASDNTFVTATLDTVESSEAKPWNAIEVTELIGWSHERGEPRLEILSRRFARRDIVYQVAVAAPDLDDALARDEVSRFLSSFKLVD